MVNVIMLSVIMVKVIMLSVIKVKVIMLSVIKVNVVMLSVLAPARQAIGTLLYPHILICSIIITLRIMLLKWLLSINYTQHKGYQYLVS